MQQRDSGLENAVAYLAAVFVVALCLGVPLLAGGVDDLAQQVADAPGDWGGALKDAVQRVLLFFEEQSYGRIAMLGAIALGGIYLWRRPGRRRE